VFDVSFDFFFCIRLKHYYVSLKNCGFVKVKIVVICFEVDIIISIITIIINIMSSADMDIANILFCRSFVNIKTQKCNHVWYQQCVVTQTLHPTESLSFLISRKLPTFYFFSVCIFLVSASFFQTQGFIQ